MITIPRLVIDADSLVYKNAWAAQQTHYEVYYKNELFQPEPFRYKKDYNAFISEQRDEQKKFFTANPVEVRLDVNLALSSIDKAIYYMRKRLNAKEIVCYLTSEDKSNFRFDLASILPYKGHRDDQKKPVYYKECREHLINKWGAIVIEGEEADDAVAQFQYPHWERLMSDNKSFEDLTCIAHIDKDIKMVPGYHYDINKHELYWVDYVEGMRHFYTQLITGDTAVDNIPGLYSITGKKALAKFKKPLQEMTDVREMYTHVYDLYESNKPANLNILDDDGDVVERDYPGTAELLHELGNLLWMRTERGQWWEAPR